jgi:hypothetical protein
MNRPESNTAAGIVDFRADKDTEFKYDFAFYDKDPITLVRTLRDLTYWDAELVLFWPETCKIIKRWSLTSGDLVINTPGIISINVLLNFEAGKYEYYLLCQDATPKIFKAFKGNFIIE